MTTTTPPSPPAADIRSLLAEFDSSGQSAAAFARSRGTAVWKLRYALSRRSGKLRTRPGAKHGQRARLLPVHLVDVAPAPAPASLELLLAGGHRLQIRADFDPEFLRRVVEALGRC